jgi:hypothetical protein
MAEGRVPNLEGRGRATAIESLAAGCHRLWPQQENCGQPSLRLSKGGTAARRPRSATSSIVRPHFSPVTSQGLWNRVWEMTRTCL